MFILSILGGMKDIVQQIREILEDADSGITVAEWTPDAQGKFPCLEPPKRSARLDSSFHLYPDKRVN